MAQPTTEHHVSPPQQQVSQNVARQGGLPDTEENRLRQGRLQPDTEENRLRQGRQPALAPVERPMPVLFDDIDPVLLVRLYPEEIQLSGARGRAMEAGMKAREDGDNLVAAQQEPVLVEGQPIPDGWGTIAQQRRPGDPLLPGQPRQHTAQTPERPPGTPPQQPPTTPPPAQPPHQPPATPTPPTPTPPHR